jgi:hypothetical protein
VLIEKNSSLGKADLMKNANRKQKHQKEKRPLIFHLKGFDYDVIIAEEKF